MWDVIFSHFGSLFRIMCRSYLKYRAGALVRRRGGGGVCYKCNFENQKRTACQKITDIALKICITSVLEILCVHYVMKDYYFNDFNYILR